MSELINLQHGDGNFVWYYNHLTKKVESYEVGMILSEDTFLVKNGDSTVRYFKDYGNSASESIKKAMVEQKESVKLAEKLEKYYRHMTTPEAKKDRHEEKGGYRPAKYYKELLPKYEETLKRRLSVLEDMKQALKDLKK